jgi:hypothetical protein
MSESSRRCFAGIFAVLLPLAFVACAADAWRASSGSDAFYDKVGRNCGTMRMGQASVNELLSGPMQSVVFLDTVSQFRNNKMSPQDFAIAASSGLHVPPDHPAILCIIAQKTP